MAKCKTTASPTSITDLLHFISTVSSYASSSRSLKCYRGQQNVLWPTVPSLLRPDLAALEQREKRAVRDLVSVHPGEFDGDRSMFDKLVRMQHFGLPTRLMDVSLNPLIALYFATEQDRDLDSEDGKVVAFAVPEEREKYYDSDSVACIANLANMTATEKQAIVSLRESRKQGTPNAKERERINAAPVIQRLHQFVREEKPHFLPIIKPIDLFKPYYVHPKMSNRRIIAQSGGFIIYGLTPPKDIRFAQVIDETVFVVPATAKPGIRHSLELIGINESTIYPELDRAAKRIKSTYNA